jgi:hypothetical protein
MGDSDGRQMPTSELDMNMMLTNPVWGRSDVPDGLKQKLMKLTPVKDDKGNQVFDEKGQPVVTAESFWDLLGHYERDFRLANLGEWNNELQTCRYMLDLATDYLTEGMVEPFLTSLSRAVTIMETSQSKNGFLRKQMNTLTQKHISQTLEPPKKGFFGGQKKEGGY